MPNTNLIKASLVALMRDLNTIGRAPAALDQLEKEFNENKNSSLEKVSEYLKPLLAANVTATDFTEVRQIVLDPNSEWGITQMCKVYDALRILKFSPAERLSKLMLAEDIHYYIRDNWDPVIVFLREVSRRMINTRCTLEQAINEELAAKRPRYTLHLRLQDINFFLSSQAIWEMYLHTRLDLVMGLHRYDGGPDDDALTKIAKFQAEHHDKRYLDADYGLKKLKFSPAQCYEFLQKYNSSESINELNTKLVLMNTTLEQVKELLKIKPTLTLAQARDSFNATASFSVNDFDLLLSPAMQLELFKIPQAVLSSSAARIEELFTTINQTVMDNRVSSTANILRLQNTTNFVYAINPITTDDVIAPLPIRAPQLTYRPISTATEINILLGVGVSATSLLALVLAYKCRIITGPINMVKFGYEKMMGLFGNSNDDKLNEVTVSKRSIKPY